jgi:hypothetical protein
MDLPTEISDLLGEVTRATSEAARLVDVLAHQERARRVRSAALDELVLVSEDNGFYDLPADVPFERSPVDHQC